MRSDVIVFIEPLFDDDMSLSDLYKPFGVEHLVTQCIIEPFIVAVLPWRTWIDVNGFNP